MLLQGINHVAVLTGDLDRFVAFYRDVFDATSEPMEAGGEMRMALVWLGDWAELNVFEISSNSEHERQVPMFGHLLSVFFRDPDGLEAEVCVANPDAVPGVHNPPGTPSRRHHPDATPLP